MHPTAPITRTQDEEDLFGEVKAIFRCLIQMTLGTQRPFVVLSSRIDDSASRGERQASAGGAVRQTHYQVIVRIKTDDRESLVAVKLPKNYPSHVG